jgi:hypothetical protein
MIDGRSSAIERVVHQLGQCLTPDTARRIAGLRADRQLQKRIDALADKNAEGLITPDEKQEFDGYVSAATFLSILQAEARRVLGEQPQA